MRSFAKALDFPRIPILSLFMKMRPARILSALMATSLIFAIYSCSDSATENDMEIDKNENQTDSSESGDSANNGEQDASDQETGNGETSENPQENEGGPSSGSGYYMNFVLDDDLQEYGMESSNNAVNVGGNIYEYDTEDMDYGLDFMGADDLDVYNKNTLLLTLSSEDSIMEDITYTSFETEPPKKMAKRITVTYYDGTGKGKFVYGGYDVYNSSSYKNQGNVEITVTKITNSSFEGSFSGTVFSSAVFEGNPSEIEEGVFRAKRNN